jgi:hypothetical protein
MAERGMGAIPHLCFMRMLFFLTQPRARAVDQSMLDFITLDRSRCTEAALWEFVKRFNYATRAIRPVRRPDLETYLPSENELLLDKHDESNV